MNIIEEHRALRSSRLRATIINLAAVLLWAVLGFGCVVVACLLEGG